MQTMTGRKGVAVVAQYREQIPSDNNSICCFLRRHVSCVLGRVCKTGAKGTHKINNAAFGAILCCPQQCNNPKAIAKTENVRERDTSRIHATTVVLQRHKKEGVNRKGRKGSNLCMHGSSDIKDHGDRGVREANAGSVNPFGAISMLGNLWL